MDNRQTSSSDRIVHDVIRGLYEGHYVPGQRLAEPDLMRRYGAGRSTVREALTRLAAEGVVTTSRFRGVAIRQLTPTQAANVLLVMELLVGLAARQAAERINTSDNQQTFRQVYEQLVAHKDRGDPWALIRARNHFYRTMTRIAGNDELERILPSIQVHLVRAQSHLDGEQRFADYELIADAVLAGDPDRAEVAARAHIVRVLKVVANVPDAT